MGRKPFKLCSAASLLRLCAAVCVVLAAACFFGQYRTGQLTLLRRDGAGPTEIEIEAGNLAVSWRPRVAYRPAWAGQTNRHGFRYNVYSDGSGYAWTPLWVPGAVMAGVAVVAGYAGRPRRARPGFCAGCGYDLRVQLALSECGESNGGERSGRATLGRCPECGRELAGAAA